MMSTNGVSDRASHDGLAHLLEWIGVRPVIAEAVLGDLTEEWHVRADGRGRAQATMWCVAEVCRSLPHLLVDAVVHGTAATRRRLAFILFVVLVLPAALTLAAFLRPGPPARVLIDGQRGGAPNTVVLNTTHPMQLAARVLDARGRVRPSTDVRYRFVSGTPAAVSPKGVIRCAQRGDAIVRASLGAIGTNVIVQCRPVTRVVTEQVITMTVGDTAHTLRFVAAGPDGATVERTAGTVEIEDASVVSLSGIRALALAPGRTVATIKVGDAEGETWITVFEPIPSLAQLRPDQLYVVAPVRLSAGQSVEWPLPAARFQLRYAAEGGGEVPTISLNGDVRCWRAGGIGEERIGCGAGAGATIRLSNDSRVPGTLRGSLSLTRESLP